MNADRDSVIPSAWLQHQLDSRESQRYADVVERLHEQMAAGDQLWWFDEPAPPGINAGELGVALVRGGRVIAAIPIGVH